MSLLHIYIRINVFREQTIVAHLKEQAWSPALLHFSLQARMQPATYLGEGKREWSQQQIICSHGSSQENEKATWLNCQ